MDDLPNQMDVLKMLMEYRKRYGPISDNSTENLADFIAEQLRTWREDQQP
jgi:hypothetical protein